VPDSRRHKPQMLAVVVDGDSMAAAVPGTGLARLGLVGGNGCGLDVGACGEVPGEGWGAVAGLVG
jgi:hypothetical protein